jgi:hypothetical protein
MKCFYHTNVDAVAVCKNCGKGLCVECATEVGKGIACKNRCEADVEAINKIFQENKKAFDNYRNAYSLSAVWVGLIGIGFSISSFILTPKLMGFLMSMGFLMIIGAIFFYFAGKRYKSN